MVWGLFSSHRGDGKAGVNETTNEPPREALPDDLRDYLQERTENGSLSDRKFQRKMQNISMRPQDYSDIDKGEDMNKSGIAEETRFDKDNKIPQLERGANEDKYDSKSQGQTSGTQTILTKKLPKRNVQTTERLGQDEIRRRRELEEYLRQNNIEESANVNCIDFRAQFAKCIEETNRLDLFKCMELEDFFANCVRLQRKSFRTFNYESMSNIEEFETIKYEIDRSFNKHFAKYEDTTNNTVLAEYDRELNRKRELFYNKYGK